MVFSRSKKRAGNPLTAPKLGLYGCNGAKERWNLVNRQEKIHFLDKHFFREFKPPISPLQMSYGRYEAEGIKGLIRTGTKPVKPGRLAKTNGSFHAKLNSPSAVFIVGQ